MNKNQQLFNPNIKKVLANLDLDLEEELARYENKYKENNFNSAQVNNDSSILTVNVIDSSFDGAEYEHPSDIGLETSLYHIDKEEVLPVAYRVLEDRRSLLDLILTPWSILSIIVFFIANAIIFIYQGIETETVNNFDNKSQESATKISKEKGNSLEEKRNLIQDNELEKQNLSSPLRNEVIPKIPEEPIASPTINQSSIMPNIPPVSSSPTLLSESVTNSINNTSNPNINPNQASNSYPDLATAVLSSSPKKVNKNSQTVEKTTSPPPPPPISTNPNNRNVASSSKKPSKNMDSEYYVVTNYNGTEELEKIQTIVPKAFLTNIGSEMKIHLGVFNDENQANELIKELKKQNISAEIITKKKS